MGSYGLLVIIAAVIWYYLRFDKAKGIILEWANTNSYEIVYLKYMWLFPFKIGIEMTYRIEIKDETGKMKKGYLTLGNIFTGLRNKNIGIRWDNESA